jgi:hypothetical protein
MIVRLILPIAFAAVAAAAPAQRSTAPRAAGQLSLDIPAPEASATPTVPDASVTGSAAAATPPAPAAATDGGARTAYTLDTPIRDLIANPATKAVLDKDLPGVSDDANLDKFDQLGLRAFQPMTGGQLTDAMLTKVARDLAGVGGASLAAPARTAPATRRRREDSR